MSFINFNENKNVLRLMLKKKNSTTILFFTQTFNLIHTTITYLIKLLILNCFRLKYCTLKYIKCLNYDYYLETFLCQIKV